MRIAKALMIVALTPSPALAQTGREAKPATITVSATGSVESAPDKASLSISIRAEGKTADAATAALAARQNAVISGLRSLDPKVEVQTSAVSIREAYAGACDNGNRFSMGSDDLESLADNLDAMADAVSLAADDMADGVPARTGKKDCTVVGRVAQIEATVIMSSVKDAGTAVGLAGRLGASRARLDDFGLRDDSAASNGAIAKAMENARAKAQAIAAASGATLGGIVSVDDGSERGMSGGLRMFAMQAPAVMAPPPIMIDVSPKPVETNARLTVTFAIER
ncbi:MAG: hypothetical protein JWN66_2130 [Sphingomonas bacterium]|uniref:SIMPL domain-containing protein n=1 Tax=Sphingomonas bacterium TaxID=1895847 RepID=UPI00262639DC|nr:SIMPL domain-containing protein [Sphingomonas bacterium]MDB5705014.1 hypothetical protein [Sphingomonas bacterium]